MTPPNQAQPRLSASVPTQTWSSFEKTRDDMLGSKDLFTAVHQLAVQALEPLVSLGFAPAHGTAFKCLGSSSHRMGLQYDVLIAEEGEEPLGQLVLTMGIQHTGHRVKFNLNLLIAHLSANRPTYLRKYALAAVEFDLAGVPVTFLDRSSAASSLSAILEHIRQIPVSAEFAGIAKALSDFNTP